MSGVQRLADGRVVLEFQLGVLQQAAVRIDRADVRQRGDDVVRLVLEDGVRIDLPGELGIQRVEQVVLLVIHAAALDVQRRRVELQVVAQLEYPLCPRVVVAVLGRVPVGVDPAQQVVLDQFALVDDDAFAIVVAQRIQRLQRLVLVGVVVRPRRREPCDHFGHVVAVLVIGPRPDAAGDHQDRRHAIHEVRHGPFAQADFAQALDQVVRTLQALALGEGDAGAQHLVLVLGQALHRRRLAAFLHRHFGAGLVVRMLAGQQLERHAAQCIDVIAGHRVFAPDHLQAGVGRGQRAQRAGIEHGLLADRVAHVLAGAGDAEVEHLGHAVAGDHDVRRLEVGMHHAGGMRAAQCARHALDQRPHLRQRHAVVGTLADQLLEVGTVDVFHRHEDDGAVLVEIVDAHDVVVRQLLRAARLALQRDQRIGMAAEFVVQHLHRDVGVAIARLDLALVACLEHHAHAAAADLPLEIEAALEQRADRDEIAGFRVGDVVPAGAVHAGTGAGPALLRALRPGSTGGMPPARRPRRARGGLDDRGLVRGRRLRGARSRLDHGGIVHVCRRRRGTRGRLHPGSLVADAVRRRNRRHGRPLGGRFDHGDVVVGCRWYQRRLHRGQLGQQRLGDQRVERARIALLLEPLAFGPVLGLRQCTTRTQRIEHGGELEFVGLVGGDQFGYGIHDWGLFIILGCLRRRQKCCPVRRGPSPGRTGWQRDPAVAGCGDIRRRVRHPTFPC